MEVCKVMPGIYQASHMGISVIGNSYGDAIQALKEELVRLSIN